MNWCRVRGDQMFWEKIHLIFQKVAKTVAQPTKAKMFNLKIQNFYVKPLLKRWIIYNKVFVETAYLGENVKKLH